MWNFSFLLLSMPASDGRAPCTAQGCLPARALAIAHPWPCSTERRIDKNRRTRSKDRFKISLTKLNDSTPSYAPKDLWSRFEKAQVNFANFRISRNQTMKRKFGENSKLSQINEGLEGDHMEITHKVPSKKNFNKFHEFCIQIAWTKNRQKYQKR